MEMEFGNLELDIKTYFEQLNERLNDRDSKIDINPNNSVFYDNYFGDGDDYIVQENQNVAVLSVIADDRDQKKYIAKVIIQDIQDILYIRNILHICI